MSTYTKLQPIRPYVSPQWLVEIDGDEVEDVDAELAEARTVTNLNEYIQGWDGYTTIISTLDENWETRYYLALQK